MDGLDTVQGLRRVAGNRKLYLSLLQQFVDGQSDAAERIREALEREERPVAERLAHSVKGTAGNLAAGEVRTRPAPSRRRSATALRLPRWNRCARGWAKRWAACRPA